MRLYTEKPSIYYCGHQVARAVGQSKHPYFMIFGMLPYFINFVYKAEFCIFLKGFSKKHQDVISRLPLISSWYQRVQEVPGIKQAAVKCNMHFLQCMGPFFTPDECLENNCTTSDEPKEEHEDTRFIGGPRPTMTKLMVDQLFIDNRN